MSWNRVQYKDAARVQADAETSARWTATTMGIEFGQVFDQGWRRILNADSTYQYEEVDCTTDNDGNVDLSTITTAVLPNRMYRLLSRAQVLNKRLAQWGTVVFNPQVTGSVVRFGGYANSPVKVWVALMPPNPERLPVLWGDVNADGVLDSSDATAIVTYTSTGAASNLDAMIQRGDVTNTGGITVADAQQVTQYLAGTMTSASAGYQRLAVQRIISGVYEFDSVADVRAVEWPEGYEYVLAQHLAAVMLTKGAVESRASGDLFAVVDSYYSEMIQSLMDRTTDHQQIVPTDSQWDWGAGPSW